MKRQSVLLYVVFLVFFAIHSARADLIPLHNTGEDGIGVETNYVLSYAANLTDTPIPMTAYAHTVGPGVWVAAPVDSHWIRPSGPLWTNDPPGYYFYELSFEIPLLTSISGQWATDNNGEIFLNGTSTGITKGLWGFTSLDAFGITGGFTGSDTLLFRVWQDGSSPSGLLVTDLTAEVVPVPPAVILGSLGLTFSGWLLHKRRML